MSSINTKLITSAFAVYYIGVSTTCFYLYDANTHNANRYIKHKSNTQTSTKLTDSLLYPISAIKSIIYDLSWPLSLFTINNKGLTCPMYNFGPDETYKQFYDQEQE